MAFTRTDTSIEAELSDKMRLLKANANQTVTDWSRMTPKTFFIDDQDIYKQLKNSKVNANNLSDLVQEKLFPDLAPELQDYLKNHANHGALHGLTSVCYFEILSEKSVSFSDSSQYKYFILDSNSFIFCEIVDVDSASTPLEAKQTHTRHEARTNLAKSVNLSLKPDPIAKMLSISKISLDLNNQVEHELLLHRNFVLSKTHGKPLFPEENDNTMFWFDADKAEVNLTIKNLIKKIVFDKSPGIFQRYKPVFIAGGVILGVSLAIFLTLLIPPVGAAVLGLAVKFGISAMVASFLGFTLTAAHIGASVATCLTGGYALFTGVALGASSLINRFKSVLKGKTKQTVVEPDVDTLETSHVKKKSSSAFVISESGSENKEIPFVIPAEAKQPPVIPDARSAIRDLAQPSPDKSDVEFQRSRIALRASGMTKK